jgi:hypothetical protein
MKTAYFIGKAAYSNPSYSVVLGAAAVLRGQARAKAKAQRDIGGRDDRTDRHHSALRYLGIEARQGAHAAELDANSCWVAS